MRLYFTFSKNPLLSGLIIKKSPVFVIENIL